MNQEVKKISCDLSALDIAGSSSSNIVELSTLNPVTELLLLENKCSVFFNPIVYKNEKLQDVISTLNPREHDLTIIFEEKFPINSVVKDIPVNKSVIEEIPVNRSVLKETCRYFQTCFYFETRFEGILPDARYHTFEFYVSSKIFKQIMEYLHTGTIELSPGNLADVTRTASYLLLWDLMDFCLDVFNQHIDCGSVDFLQNFADKYLFDKVSAAVFDFKLKRFEAVWKSGVFRSWSHKHIYKVLCSSQVVVSEEKKVLIFLFQWLNADFEQRNEHANKLLQKISWSFITELNLEEVADGNKNDQLIEATLQISREFAGVETQPRLYDKGIYRIGTGLDSEWKLEKYLPDANTVKVLRAPDCSYRMKLVANNDKMYAINASGSCQVYHSLTDIWEARAPMNYRDYHPQADSFVINSVCSFRNEIFAFNSYSIDGHLKPFCLIYSETTDTWRHLPLVLPAALQAEVLAGENCRIVTATTCGDSIYLVPSTNTTNRMIQYTPSTEEWTPIADPDSIRDLQSREVVTHNSHLVLTDRHDVPDQMLVFCTDTKVFKECAYTYDDGYGRQLLSTVLWNDSLYIFPYWGNNNTKGHTIAMGFMDDPVEDPTPVAFPGWKSDITICYAIANMI